MPNNIRPACKQEFASKYNLNLIPSRHFNKRCFDNFSPMACEDGEFAAAPSGDPLHVPLVIFERSERSPGVPGTTLSVHL
jgi:hypothetical protein